MANPGTFVFVDVNADIHNEKVRKQVRSRAAAHSHMVAPRSFKRRPSKWIDEREKAPTRVRKKRVDLALRITRPSAKSAASEAKATSPGVPISDGTENMALTIRTSESALAALRPTVAAQSVQLGRSVAMDQPRLKYPVPFHPIFARLFQLLPQYIHSGWQVLETCVEKRNEGVGWVLRNALAEPAYFYVNMLSMSDYYTQRGHLDPRISAWLRMKYVASLNEALQQPDGRLRIGVLMSICRIAFLETLYGDRNTGHNVHRPALARLLVMSGGLEDRDLPDICIRHLKWSERLCTKVTGKSMAEMEPELARYWQDDGNNQLSKKDIEMLEKYIPWKPKVGD